MSARGAKRWADGHPWIFRSDVVQSPAGQAGVVDVRDPRGRAIGTALWSSASEIALRLLDSALDTKIDAVWWHERLARAIARRTAVAPVATAYRLVHGEGVAIGLACAMRFSTRLRLCAEQDAERVVRHLASVGLPTRIRDIPGWQGGADAILDADSILDAMYQDKKVERGALTFILLRGIGAAFVAKSVDADDVRGFLQEELERE